MNVLSTGSLFFLCCVRKEKWQLVVAGVCCPILKIWRQRTSWFGKLIFQLGLLNLKRIIAWVSYPRLYEALSLTSMFKIVKSLKIHPTQSALHQTAETKLLTEGHNPTLRKHSAYQQLDITIRSWWRPKTEMKECDYWICIHQVNTTQNERKCFS